MSSAEDQSALHDMLIADAIKFNSLLEQYKNLWLIYYPLKIIIEENAEQHVGPIRTPIKDMPYKLEIIFEGYPEFLNNFYVNLEAKSEDGDMKMSLSCKT